MDARRKAQLKASYERQKLKLKLAKEKSANQAEEPPLPAQVDETKCVEIEESAYQAALAACKAYEAYVNKWSSSPSGSQCKPLSRDEWMTMQMTHANQTKHK